MRAYLELVRIPAVFTAPSDVMAGASLAFVAGAALDPLLLTVAAVASAALYCAGMAANDIFDLDIDRQERPGRPIPSGRVSLRSAWGLVLGLQALALGLGAWGGRDLLIAVSATIGATYLYNVALKDTPLGPFAMGACRYGNALVGYAALAPLAVGAGLWVPLGTLAYVAALTWLSRYEVDGASARLIRRPASAMVVLSQAPLLAFALGWLPVWWAAAACVVPLLWLAKPLLTAVRVAQPGAVRGGMMAGIYGIALINAVIALGAGAWVPAAIAAGLLIPGKRFGRWFYAT